MRNPNRPWLLGHCVPVPKSREPRSVPNTTIFTAIFSSKCYSKVVNHVETATTMKVKSFPNLSWCLLEYNNSQSVGAHTTCGSQQASCVCVCICVRLCVFLSVCMLCVSVRLSVCLCVPVYDSVCCCVCQCASIRVRGGGRSWGSPEGLSPWIWVWRWGGGAGIF